MSYYDGPIRIVYQKPTEFSISSDGSTFIQQQQQQQQQLRRALPHDIILHAAPRSALTAHLSPFVMKLESWLRLNKIPYTFTSQNGQHPKTGKMPWIEYEHGKIQLFDTESIMEHIRHFYFDDGRSANFIDYGADEVDLATMRAFQRMIDEHLYWATPQWRFVRDPELRIWAASTHALPPMSGVKRLLGKWALGRNVKKAAHGQGLGRLDDAMLIERISEDLQAASDYLGSKPFLMGDAVRSVDCSLFGNLAQLLWVDTTSPWTRQLYTRWPNLVHYAERMRAKCYPDWNELTEAAAKLFYK